MPCRHGCTRLGHGYLAFRPPFIDCEHCYARDQSSRPTNHHDRDRGDEEA